MVVSLLKAISPDCVSAISPALWAMIIGFGIWNFLYVTVPPPVRTYVFAHELTHALWASLMGARVSKMRVSKSGGSVTVSKNNFLITLAPYFFPLYTVLVVLLFYVLSRFLDLGAYHLYWLGLVGFTWGFHLTFTVGSLFEHQTDIKEYGHVFSYAVIYLFNVIGIGLWIVLVSDATIGQLASLFGHFSADIWLKCWETVVSIWAGIMQ